MTDKRAQEPTFVTPACDTHMPVARQIVCHGFGSIAGATYCRLKYKSGVLLASSAGDDTVIADVDVEAEDSDEFEDDDEDNDDAEDKVGAEDENEDKDEHCSTSANQTA